MKKPTKNLRKSAKEIRGGVKAKREDKKNINI